MPFCQKCGKEISELQFQNYNKMCSKCLRREREYQIQMQTMKKIKSRMKQKGFWIIRGIMLIIFTLLGTVLVMSIHYWYIVEIRNLNLGFGTFFLRYFFPDVLIGLLVGLVAIIVIIVVFDLQD
ncbi:MAG: hypothetical protein ACFFB0_15975 [Promethearchaeota archaeon]